MSQGNFDYKRPIYSLNCSTQDVVVEENGTTGSANHVEDETRERSSSMISIVSVHHEDVEGYDDGDSDREAVAIEDNQPATNGDTIMNLNLNDPRLTLLRRYLRFQWFPRKVTFGQKAFWTTVQFLIFGFLIFCYALDMGALDHRSLVEEQWEASQETVTAAKNIIWSLRLLEMYILVAVYSQQPTMCWAPGRHGVCLQWWRPIQTAGKLSTAPCTALLPYSWPCGLLIIHKGRPWRHQIPRLAGFFIFCPC